MRENLYHCPWVLSSPVYAERYEDTAQPSYYKINELASSWFGIQEISVVTTLSLIPVQAGSISHFHKTFQSSWPYKPLFLTTKNSPRIFSESTLNLLTPQIQALFFRALKARSGRPRLVPPDRRARTLVTMGLASGHPWGDPNFWNTGTVLDVKASTPPPSRILTWNLCFLESQLRPSNIQEKMQQVG